MTDSPHLDSVRLFFESFAKHLSRIRDDGKDAGQAYRAQILMGQLQQFEKAILEYQGTRSAHADDEEVLKSLLHVTDLNRLVEWLSQTQSLAPVTDVYYVTQEGNWEQLMGDAPIPAKRAVRTWLERGVLGRPGDSERHFVFYVYGQPRLLLAHEEISGAEQAVVIAFMTWLSRLLPLFIKGRIVERTKVTGAMEGVVARDAGFLELLTLIQRVSERDVTILLEGESGTGKEVIANFIARNSARVGKPFVAVNCAAIPAGLIESELFGHEKGSFTGAIQRKIGRLEEAQGGTLFLDEIGEIELSMQAKLLRFLQLRELHRVGGRQKISVDVRIIAATNRDLKKRVAEGHFREDLYYRLSVTPFKVPPLRNRIDDIPPLVDFFIEKYAEQFNMPIPEIEDAVYSKLTRYHFPGNVRELENLIQSVLVLSQGNRLKAEHLPAEIHQLEPDGRVILDRLERPMRWRRRRARGRVPLNLAMLGREGAGGTVFDWDQNLPSTNDELKDAKQKIQDWAKTQTLELERTFLENLLDRADGSMPEASKISGINRTLLYKMLERTKGEA